MKKYSLPIKIITLFVLSRIFFGIIAQIAPQFIPPDQGYLGLQIARGTPRFLWEWGNMDSRHFIWVARDGYSGTNFAFFPLFPVLLGSVHHLTSISYLCSGLLLSNIFTLFSIYFLVKIIKLDGENSSVFETVLLLLIFPFSFILNTVYADALFLFVTTTSLYFARKKHWSASGVFAALASLTRFSGLALFPALIVEWWLQRKQPFKKIAIAPILNLSGFFIYTIYLQLNHNNWRLFQTSMKTWGQEKFVSIFQVLFRYLKIFVSVSPHTLVFWIALFEFVTFFLYFTLAIYVYKKIRASYGLFMMISLFLVTLTGTLAGTQRYLIHLFPAFIGLSLIMKRHSRFRYIYYPLTIILAIVLTILFVQGRFVG